jgi:hypothetical protein
MSARTQPRSEGGEHGLIPEYRLTYPQFAAELAADRRPEGR